MILIYFEISSGMEAICIACESLNCNSTIICSKEDLSEYLTSVLLKRTSYPLVFSPLLFIFFSVLTELLAHYVDSRYYINTNHTKIYVQQFQISDVNSNIKLNSSILRL